MSVRTLKVFSSGLQPNSFESLAGQTNYSGISNDIHMKGPSSGTVHPHSGSYLYNFPGAQYRPCKETAFQVTSSIIEPCVWQVVHGKGLTDIFQGRIALQQSKTAGNCTGQLNAKCLGEVKWECKNCVLLLRFVAMPGLIRVRQTSPYQA